MMRVMELDTNLVATRTGVDVDSALFTSLMEDVATDLGLVADVKYGGHVVDFKGKGTNESMIAYDIGLNTHKAHLLAKDKENCSTHLLTHGVSVVVHTRLSNGLNGKSSVGGMSNVDLLEVVLEHYSFPMVVKDNKGGAGKNVFLVHGLADLVTALSDLMARGLDPCVSKYYDFSTEYRVVVLDGEVMLSFGKRKQDGSFQHNLSSGATVVSLPVELESSVHDLALKATKALRLRFATVDIIETPDGLKVLEVNDSVTLKRVLKYGEYYRLAHNAYKTALTKVMEDND